METVCAMLNGGGGFVLIGVKNDGTIIGQEVADSTRRDIAEEIKKIDPQIVLEPEVVPLTDESDPSRCVIVLSVPGDRPGPYSYDGRPYVRQSATTTWTQPR